MHTTNYVDTFIEVAEDCPATEGEAPPARDPKTAAQITFELLVADPYRLTSDDVLYAANGERRGISRDDFFSTGQPCLRSSPLTKRYGWGVHADGEGLLAIFPVHSSEYRRLAADPRLRHLKAMRSKRA